MSFRDTMMPRTLAVPCDTFVLVMRLDPIIALTGGQRVRLAGADVRDAAGVLRVSPALTLDQLAGAPMLVNARTLLAALAEAPVRATKELGNLELRFVARMLDELQFDSERREMLRYVSRRPHEDDVPELHVLRVVLGLAGLIKKRNGRFSITRRGGLLLAPERAAELYELLLRTYFGKFNIFYVYGGREDPLLQRHIVLALWTIRRLAEHPVSGARIAALMPRNLVLWDPRFGPGQLYPRELEGIVSYVLLRPLRGFGLLQGGEETGPFLARERAPWQVAPLFDEAISFELGEAGDDAAPVAGRQDRHLHLVTDARGDAPPAGGAGSAVRGGAARTRTHRSGDVAPSVVRLRITLQGVEPAVWRRLEVPADSTFESLHRYLNIAMGWLDYHLHAFEVGRRRIAAPDPDWESEWPHEDESRVTLGDVLARGARAFVYRYDFGDDWEHLVEVEHVGPPEPDVFYPRCLEAVGACPPEDCGGVPGYLDLREALQDPQDPEHAELLEWLGGPFDPDRVDVEGIDRLLRLATTGELRPDDLDYFAAE